MSLVHHTVLFKFPSIATDVPAPLADVVSAFNALPGIDAHFAPHGAGIGVAVDKASFLESVSWPDKTEGYTHCLLVMAQDTASLKAYLHSDEHLKQWMPAVKPYIEYEVRLCFVACIPRPVPENERDAAHLLEKSLIKILLSHHCHLQGHHGL